MDKPTESSQNILWTTPANRLDHLTQLNVMPPPQVPREALIGVTLGPSSDHKTTIDTLIKKGVELFVVNFDEHHSERIKSVRQLSLDAKIPVAIAVDLSNAKLANAVSTRIETGQSVLLSSSLSLGLCKCFKDSTDLERFQTQESLFFLAPHEIRTILSFEIMVKRVCECEQQSDTVECVITKLSDSLQPILESDCKQLHLEDPSDIVVMAEALKSEPDVVIVDFIHSFSYAKTISVRFRELRDLSGARNVSLFLKIGSKQAIDEIEMILPFVDGLICDRRRLTTLTSIYRQNTIQKKLTANCNLVGKPIICSGNVLHSMIASAIPTRAEICDVGNAILDGCGGVLLGYTTAFGERPLETAIQLDSIVHEAQRCQTHRYLMNNLLESRKMGKSNESEVLAVSIVQASIEANAKLIIIVDTNPSERALMQYIAKYRPPAVILWVSRDLSACRKCLLYRGYRTLFIDEQTIKSEMDKLSQIKLMVEMGLDYGRKFVNLRQNEDVIIVREDMIYEDTFNMKIVKCP